MFLEAKQNKLKSRREEGKLARNAKTQNVAPVPAHTQKKKTKCYLSRPESDRQSHSGQ